MNEQVTELVSNLEEHGQQVVEYFTGLGDEVWEREVYSDGELWTVRTILAHMVETEGSLLQLYQSIAGGGAGTPVDFDVNRWNQSKMSKMADMTPAELIPMFEERRQSTIDWMGRLDEATLKREGRQAAVGVQPLAVLITVFYEHGKGHLADLKGALA